MRLAGRCSLKEVSFSASTYSNETSSSSTYSIRCLNGRFIHIKKVRETVRTNTWLQLRYTPNSGHIAPLRRASDCTKTVVRVVFVIGIFASIRVPEPGLEVM